MKVDKREDKILVSMTKAELADILLTSYKTKHGIINFKLNIDPASIALEEDIQFVVNL